MGGVSKARLPARFGTGGDRPRGGRLAGGALQHQVFVIGQRAEVVAEALGGKSALARALGVSASQPTRWISGVERPSVENARVIVDLDHVVARAGLVWTPPVVQAWLVGRNAFLGGARPVDVLKTEGPARVIDALDQELSGAYA